MVGINRHLAGRRRADKLAGTGMKAEGRVLAQGDGMRVDGRREHAPGWQRLTSWKVLAQGETYSLLAQCEKHAGGWA